MPLSSSSAKEEKFDLEASLGKSMLTLNRQSSVKFLLRASMLRHRLHGDERLKLVARMLETNVR